MPLKDLTPWASAGSRLRLSDESARQRVQAVRARARYDAAQTTEENRNTFAAADGFAADAANNPGVRMILRNRCRYLHANNPRAKGMFRTLANHTVGVGPRLQLQLGDGPAAKKLAGRIETAFQQWFRLIGGAKKLRTLRVARVVSGEAFAARVINPALAHDVQLDVQLLECDRVMSPWGSALGERDVDGLRFDEFGNVAAYQVMRCHPGDYRLAKDPTSFVEYSSQVLSHYFDSEDRPETHRGVPEIAPVVQVFEEGRRFRAAVLAAAETAADYALFIQSDAPANAEDADVVDPMDTLEIQRRMATTLPQGWKISQTKPEQPIANFKEFAREIVAECARCIHMPVTIATLDAGDANMSAHYVVDQNYVGAILIERQELETTFLDPWFDAWLTLAVDPTVGVFKRLPRELPHSWYWPQLGQHADPAKVANARDTSLKNHSTTLAREYAKQGLDWEEELRQRAKEESLMKELGLSIDQASPPAPAAGSPSSPGNADPNADGENNADEEADA